MTQSPEHQPSTPDGQSPSAHNPGAPGSAPAGDVPGEIGASGWRILALSAGALAIVLSAIVFWLLAQTGGAGSGLAVRVLEAKSAPPQSRSAAPVSLDTRQVALSLLPAKAVAGNEFRMTVFDPDGERAFGVDGVRRSSSGDFAVLVRTGGLRAGDHRLVLEERRRDPSTGAAGEWAELGEYSLRFFGGR